MKSLIPCLFFIVLLSCGDEEPLSQVIEVNSFTGINLRSIKAGDQSTYVLYQSGCDGGFHFTGDTLIVSIVERNDSTFMHESYTQGSAREGTAIHPIIQRNGYVLIPNRTWSQFLFFYGNDTIFLDESPQIELEQVGCNLFHNGEAFTGDFIGNVEKFQFGDIQIHDKKGISCVPTILQIDAYIIYDDYLNMVHIIQDDFEEQTIFGFMAIE